MTTWPVQASRVTLLGSRPDMAHFARTNRDRHKLAADVLGTGEIRLRTRVSSLRVTGRSSIFKGPGHGAERRVGELTELFQLLTPTESAAATEDSNSLR